MGSGASHGPSQDAIYDEPKEPPRHTMGSGASHGPSQDAIYEEPKAPRGDTKKETSQEERIFQEVKNDILNDLEPDEVIDLLRESGSLSEEEHRKITSGGSRREKCKRLYDLLRKRLPESFHALYFALHRTDNKHLIAKMDGQSTWYYPKADPNMTKNPLPEMKLTCTGVQGKRAGKPSELLLELTVSAKRAEIDFDKMIKVLEEPLAKCRIDDKLFKTSLCLIAKFESSPAILHLRPLGKFRMQTFEPSAEECVKLLVGEIIERNNAGKVGEQFGKDEVLEVNYGLHCQYTEEEEKSTTESAINELKKHTDLLAEELEANNFLKSLEFLTKKEVGEVTHTQRRRDRVKGLLDLVFQKGDGAAEEFINILLEDPMFGPLGRNTISHVPGIKAMHTIADNYEHLADQMIPDTVAHACSEAGLLAMNYTHSALWKKTRGERSLRSTMLMHTIMLGGVDDARKFCDILKAQGYALSGGGEDIKAKK